MAHDEYATALAGLEKTEKRLLETLAPDDEISDSNVLLEIRAASGGDEAALFAAEMNRMYERFAVSRGWKAKLLTRSPGDKGLKVCVYLVVMVKTTWLVIANSRLRLGRCRFCSRQVLGGLVEVSFFNVGLIILLHVGKDVFRTLKHEMGVHR